MKKIEPLSGVPLYIEVCFNDLKLANATGFLVKNGISCFLISNWHVFSGRHPDTGLSVDKDLAIPNKIKVHHHKKGYLGQFVIREYFLSNEEEKPLYIEKRLSNTSMIDVAALEIKIESEIDYQFLDLKLSTTDILLYPSDSVSIIGFPDGVSVEGFPVWKTGHIASDLDLDYCQKPAFLIDATTKSGMSGSPVIAQRVGGHPTSNGFNLAGGAQKFLGIYSGRVSDKNLSDLVSVGLVWKLSTILDLIL